MARWPKIVVVTDPVTAPASDPPDVGIERQPIDDRLLADPAKEPLSEQHCGDSESDPEDGV